MENTPGAGDRRDDMSMRFQRTPDVPRTDRGVLLFRSCLVSAEYPGVEASTKWLFERFGIEYTIHPEQTCCTGLGYYSDLMPIRTTVALAARNACVAVGDDHPTMCYLCSTCYAINKKARDILTIDEQRRSVSAYASSHPGYSRLVAQSHSSGTPVKAGQSVRGGFGSSRSSSVS